MTAPICHAEGFLKVPDEGNKMQEGFCRFAAWSTWKRWGEMGYFWKGVGIAPPQTPSSDRRRWLINSFPNAFGREPECLELLCLHQQRCESWMT